MKRVISQMNLTEITNCYGMTETSPVSFQTGTHDSFERRVSTVGRVHPHIQVRVVDRSAEDACRAAFRVNCTREGTQ